jgi:hypothetical protein
MEVEMRRAWVVKSTVPLVLALGLAAPVAAQAQYEFFDAFIVVGNCSEVRATVAESQLKARGPGTVTLRVPSGSCAARAMRGAFESREALAGVALSPAPAQAGRQPMRVPGRLEYPNITIYVPDPADPNTAEFVVAYRAFDRETAAVQHNESDYDFLAMHWASAEDGAILAVSAADGPMPQGRRRTDVRLVSPSFDELESGEPRQLTLAITDANLVEALRRAMASRRPVGQIVLTRPPSEEGNRAQHVAISLRDVRVRSVAQDPAGGSTWHVTWTYSPGGVTSTDNWDENY